jgi:hypothetical protein
VRVHRLGMRLVSPKRMTAFRCVVFGGFGVYARGLIRRRSHGNGTDLNSIFGIDGEGLIKIPAAIGKYLTYVLVLHIVGEYSSLPRFIRHDYPT